MVPLCPKKHFNLWLIMPTLVDEWWQITLMDFTLPNNTIVPNNLFDII